MKNILNQLNIYKIVHLITAEYTFFLSSYAEAETLILWPPDAKSWLIGNDPDAGKDWRQEEKGRTEDDIVGWHKPTQWTWVWVNSGSWWWTGRPGMLWSMGSQRVGHDWVTELNWEHSLRSQAVKPVINSKDCMQSIISDHDGNKWEIINKRQL